MRPTGFFGEVGMGGFLQDLRYAARMLFKSPWVSSMAVTSDPAVYALVSLVLVATGLTASAVPAHRATRVDPLVALRSD